MKKFVPFFILTAIVIPVISSAHVYILESFPPENSVMYESPKTVAITFVG